MRNKDFVVLIIVLLVGFFLFYKLVPIFFDKALPDNYVIGKDSCKNDLDCRNFEAECIDGRCVAKLDFDMEKLYCDKPSDCKVINKDCSGCTFDPEAVRIDFDAITDCFVEEYCDTFYEMPKANCVDNRCVIA